MLPNSPLCISHFIPAWIANNKVTTDQLLAVVFYVVTATFAPWNFQYNIHNGRVCTVRELVLKRMRL